MPIPPTQLDPAHDLLKSDAPPLQAIFQPSTVAVIGASETAGSVGRTLQWNLMTNPFGGTVFPVNPKRDSIMGIKAYAAIGDVPAAVDLALIATPAETVPGLVQACVDAGVKAAIIISAGFREVGEAGAALEQEILAIAAGRMRIVGPNCLGVMNPYTGLNATFAADAAQPGRVAFISQSGALCTAVLDWARREGVGFSTFASIGSMLDVGWGDLIDHLGDDPHTKSILLYMESIGDARKFLSAAREVALTKPIIVIKAGRSDAAAAAAASHTGTLAGSDDVLDAAFRRTGVLRVDRLSDLFHMAEVLAKQPRPAGNRLTILANAGGPGVLATDALVAGGGQLAMLSDETQQQLQAMLPPHASTSNPVDILGDADAERYARAFEVVAADPGSDGLLVILTPQAMTDPTRTAERLKTVARPGNKPVIMSWMGAGMVEAGREILNRADVPTFDFPDQAARVFNYMWRYSYNLNGLYETPTLTDDISPADDADRQQRADRIIREAREAGQTILTELASKQLLSVYDIPVLETHHAESADAAVAHAASLGYPVALKLHSHTLTHKSDVGGVKLSLPDADAVREAFDAIRDAVAEKAGAEHFQGVTVQPMVAGHAYELIVGSSLDAQFGPVILFGLGGELVELFRDRALALPPLNQTLARRMMEQTKIYTALRGVRGRKAVDLAALEQLLVRFSRFVVEQPWVKEIDINPLRVSAEGMVALDARVVLHTAEMDEAALPRPVVRPYPVQYVERWQAADGTSLTLRPIRPEDEPLMVRFHETLSEHTVYMRYFHPIHLSQRVSHDRLSRLCYVDYDRQIAMVAERRDADTGERQLLGVGRLTRLPGTNRAEYAVLVSDAFQHQGLGTELLRRLVEIARAEGVAVLEADILPYNHAMQKVSKRLGFTLNRSDEDHTIKATLDFRRSAEGVLPFGDNRR
ncbi:bifunctional acetate--CoA ligase family protein/GNAT family N-acetyltransferase [Phycisphaerales bacterium AB-hyl4]|uniref:Bifunctional acetate--CoA ligase family protein/GNAT family N-acetyltransferase n=1 Tax=Natronomicrosphaera hydrolytica TaxID=3242702 RepID=A0ABV4U4U8_9BACT